MVPPMTDAADAPTQSSPPRPWPGAGILYMITILLFSALMGAFVWELVIEPGLVAIRTRASLGAELTAYIGRASEQAILLSPALFLASALWSVSAILRRARTGGFSQASAGSLADAGAAMMWAGGMEFIGIPTLWAWTHSRMGRLVMDYDLAALGLIAVGVAVVFTGQALRSRPVQP